MSGRQTIVTFPRQSRVNVVLSGEYNLLLDATPSNPIITSPVLFKFKNLVAREHPTNSVTMTMQQASYLALAQ